MKFPCFGKFLLGVGNGFGVGESAPHAGRVSASFDVGDHSLVKSMLIEPLLQENKNESAHVLRAKFASNPRMIVLMVSRRPEAFLPKA